ncbi:DUF2007 domain-containing protein [Psychromonas sp. PT13]|uniref:putative signal transducing protein n=1 Tax=Psychromonas sp. PT13 TaxID=3439547 RepID=UPI003EBF7AC6
MMKLVYTNENHFLVSNIQNLIEAEQINTFIKNEFAQGAAGDISVFDAWPEVWVYDDADFERATNIVKLLESKANDADWLCKHCGEGNDPSFDICWKCQSDKS